MMNELSNALSILVVGMVTVFFILWLVVLIGNAIIFIVNRISKNAQKEEGKINGSNNPKQNTLAAIVAAVEVVTQGKGKIVDIKQIN